MSFIDVPSSPPSPPVISDARPAVRARSRAWVWIAPLAVYFVVSVPIALRQLDRMNPDSVAYVRRAMYLAQGNFSASVSGYWSPMISWSIAPFVAIGVDPLHAARYALLLWGIAFLLAFYLLLQRIADVPDWWKMLALSAGALVVPTFALHQITPDVILATWLMLYFSVLLSPRFLTSRRLTVGAGVLGGVAYLAKAYAFPFVLLHLPMTVVMRTFAERKDEPIPALLRRAVSTSAIALLGFAIVALPWVTILSLKYGHFTFSTTGRIAHAVVGPPGHPKPSATRLERAPDPYLSANENPESAGYTFWSPFDSKAAFDHQRKIVRDNAAAMARVIYDYGVALLPGPRLWIPGLLLALAAGLLTALVPTRLPNGTRWLLIWVIATVVLYVSGYLFVFFVPRYIVPVILPLLLALSLLVASLLRRWTTGLTGAAFVALVAIGVAWGAVTDLKPLWNTQSHTWHRRIAAELKERNLTGPIASSDRIKGMYVAFHAGQKFAGFPSTKNPFDANRELLAHHPAAFLVWDRQEKGDDDDGQDDSSVAQRVAKSGRWKSVFASTHRKDRVEIFVPIDADEKKGGPP